MLGYYWCWYWGAVSACWSSYRDGLVVLVYTLLRVWFPNIHRRDTFRSTLWLPWLTFEVEIVLELGDFPLDNFGNFGTFE